MSLFEGMERSEGMIKAVAAAPEKYLLIFAEVLVAIFSFYSQTLSNPIFVCLYLLLLFSLVLTFGSGIFCCCFFL